MAKYKVYFSNDQENCVQPCISIRATGSPNWNDFLFNFEAMLEINSGDDREKLMIPAYVMPTDAEGDFKRLGAWVNHIDLNSEKDKLFNETYEDRNYPKFISLFDGAKFYQQLKTWTNSVAERYEILSLLNDVVFLKNVQKYPKDIINEIVRSPGFMYGVLRSPATYRALRRGWREIQAQKVESLADAKMNFKFSARLDGFENTTHDLNVVHLDNDIFDDRIQVLIGVNGTGKTRLLRELTLTIASKFSVKEKASVFVDDDQSEAISAAELNGPPFNRVTVFSSTAENRFPRFTRDDTAFEYQYFNLTSQDEKDVHGVKSIRVTKASVVVDILRDGDIFRSTSENNETRFDLLLRSVNEHVDLDYLYLPVINDGKELAFKVVEDEQGGRWVRAVDILRLNEQRMLELTATIDEDLELDFFKPINGSKKIRKMFLSSGQNIFFSFALRFISTIDVGTLVLIDEPETHLHPNLVCDFMSILYDVLISTKSMAIIATHSSYIVREVPTHSVHICSFDGASNKISVGKVRMKTLGASLDSISQAVFGDATIEKYHEKIAKEIAQGNVDLSEIVERYSSVMSPEMLIQIRADMDLEEELFDGEDE